MEQGSLISHAGEAVTAAAIATALAFSWIIYRSSSWHILKLRLWRLAHGKGEINDPQLKSGIDSLTNLTAFRFHFYKVANWSEAKLIMEWAENHGFDLGTLHACGNYFEPKTRALKIPSLPLRRAWIARGLSLMVLTLVMTAVVTLGLIPRAFVTFNNTGQWVALGKSEAKLMFHEGAMKLSKDNCSNPPADLKNTYFNAEQVSTLCTFFSKTTSARFVDDNIRLQRTAAGFITVVLCYFFACIHLAWMHINAAWSLQDLLKEKYGPPPEDGSSRTNRTGEELRDNRLLRFKRVRRGSGPAPI